MRLSAFRRLRRRVRRATGPAKDVLLRRYLRAKAARGEWDRRYFAYNGVDPNVTPKLKAAATRAYAAGLVPTSSTGGQHSPGSWHFRKDAQGRGRGLDLGNRRRFIGTNEGRERMVRVQRAEHRRGPDFWQEVIGPDNGAIILAGRETDLGEGTALEQMHDTHVHLADAS